MKTLRNIMIAKIHLAKNQLGLDDDTYRSIIQQAVGKDSSTKCTDKQLEKVIEKLKEKGWKDAKPPMKSRINPQSAKSMLCGAFCSVPEKSKARTKPPLTLLSANIPVLTMSNGWMKAKPGKSSKC